MVFVSKCPNRGFVLSGMPARSGERVFKKRSTLPGPGPDSSSQGSLGGGAGEAVMSQNIDASLNTHRKALRDAKNETSDPPN
jgi:hypothetical protein